MPSHAAPRRLRSAIATGLLLTLCGVCAASAKPQLHASPALSSDGVTQLSWQLQGQPVELQRASDAGFSQPLTIYRGTDSASLRSGLANGLYFYRLRSLAGDGAPGDWSEPVQVQVAHHPARRAWGMFALGALVFLCTLGLILWGGRRETADG